MSLAHTDHPMRHWDRTCPACQQEAMDACDKAFWESVRVLPEQKSEAAVQSKKEPPLNDIDLLRTLVQCLRNYAAEDGDTMRADAMRTAAAVFERLLAFAPRQIPCPLFLDKEQMRDKPDPQIGY